MDFFHCNSCFSQPGPPRNLKFCLTSCGHTFCTDCLSLTSSKCKECQTVCKVLPLTKDIPANLQLYFSDLMIEVKKIIKILLVQNKHYSIYVEEYGPNLESNIIRTKNILDKRISEIDILKRNNEMLLSENEMLKKEIIHLKQVKRNYPVKETPLRDSRNVFLSGSKNFGSRSVENSYLFKPSSNKKPAGFFTSSPADNSFLNQPQRMTPMSASIKSKCTLRDNMRMLKPQTPASRVNQTFTMASKSPDFPQKGSDEGSPGSWCSSISSIKSPYIFKQNSYFQKP